nr:hypothetical protein [Escherichia coli]
MTYPRVQTFEYLRGLCQPEVGLPASKVYPHLFGNLAHALASNASGDEPVSSAFVNATMFDRFISLALTNTTELSGMVSISS